MRFQLIITLILGSITSFAFAEQRPATMIDPQQSFDSHWADKIITGFNQQGMNEATEVVFNALDLRRKVEIENAPRTAVIKSFHKFFQSFERLETDVESSVFHGDKVANRDELRKFTLDLVRERVQQIEPLKNSLEATAALEPFLSQLEKKELSAFASRESVVVEKLHEKAYNEVRKHSRADVVLGLVATQDGVFAFDPSNPNGEREALQKTPSAGDSTQQPTPEYVSSTEVLQLDPLSFDKEKAFKRMDSYQEYGTLTRSVIKSKSLRRLKTLLEEQSLDPKFQELRKFIKEQKLNGEYLDSSERIQLNDDEAASLRETLSYH